MCTGDFKDYVQAKNKETNEIEIFRLVIDGKMNPKFNDYEIIQDPDLNKGVKYHCESISEDFEDDIIDFFAKESASPSKESEIKFCEKITNICPHTKDEL